MTSLCNVVPELTSPMKIAMLLPETATTPYILQGCVDFHLSSFLVTNISFIF